MVSLDVHVAAYFAGLPLQTSSTDRPINCRTRLFFLWVCRPVCLSIQQLGSPPARLFAAFLFVGLPGLEVGSVVFLCFLFCTFLTPASMASRPLVVFIELAKRLLVATHGTSLHVTTSNSRQPRVGQKNCVRTREDFSPGRRCLVVLLSTYILYVA